MNGPDMGGLPRSPFGFIDFKRVDADCTSIGIGGFSLRDIGMVNFAYSIITAKATANIAVHVVANNPDFSTYQSTLFDCTAGAGVAGYLINPGSRLAVVNIQAGHTTSVGSGQLFLDGNFRPRMIGMGGMGEQASSQARIEHGSGLGPATNDISSIHLVVSVTDGIGRGSWFKVWG